MKMFFRLVLVIALGVIAAVLDMTLWNAWRTGHPHTTPIMGVVTRRGLSSADPLTVLFCMSVLFSAAFLMSVVAVFFPGAGKWSKRKRDGLWPNLVAKDPDLPPSWTCAHCGGGGRILGISMSVGSVNGFEARGQGMSRETIEVGAFTWSRVQRLYDADPAVHWRRCAAAGLECPQEVFAQLFHAEEMHSMPTESADVRPGVSRLLNLWSVRAVDWGRWQLEELSGIAVRQVRVDRGYQYAVDEAWKRAGQFSIVDEQEEVANHWREAKSWVVAPVIVAADLLGGGTGFQLVVGFTRLGNMLALLDREEIPEVQKHLVWIGR
jgi:hypothetical protein